MNEKLSKKEKQIADDFAKGLFRKKKDTHNFKKIAQATKDARINLRLQSDVLEYFQKKSDKLGIPYQTLINSVLYKVAIGQIVEKEELDVLSKLEEISLKIDNLNKKKGA